MNTAYAQSREQKMRQGRRWQGDDIVEVSGRTRAIRLFPEKLPCGKCSHPKGERHHKDGNTTNNAPSNIEFLCRRCHMIADGRMEQIKERALRNSALIAERRRGKAP